MKPAAKFTWKTVLPVLLIAACAAGARSWYLVVCTDQGWYEPILQVQGEDPQPPWPAGTTYRSRERPTELDNLAENITEYDWFGGWAPFAEKEEVTAHRAPGYAWLIGKLAGVPNLGERADWATRWLQCVLGSLTVVFFHLFARRAFQSDLIAAVAGLMAAFYPFWIINTAEINDGVLTTFLFSAGMMLGARSSQTGGAFSGLFFGVSLAGLCMVRAALTPFAIVALLWFLYRCRRIPRGWFAGILCLVGFLNGVAPWAVRNYQMFNRPVPVATTAYYHLWMGNNASATGSVVDETTLRSNLSESRAAELLSESNQAKRYDMLATEFWEEVRAQPSLTMDRRIKAARAFLLGESWVTHQHFAGVREAEEDATSSPEWVTARAESILHATVLGMFVLALLGWRWSYAQYKHGRLASIAALWIPLPYVLSHAEALSGPRLPLDGVLLCYAAYALVSIVPGLVREPEFESYEEPERED